MRSVHLVLVSLLASSCTTNVNPTKYSNIGVITIEQAKKCSYIDTVLGTSSLYGMFAETGIDNAKLSAFEKARSTGGTHLVWENFLTNYGSSQVGAKVFICK